MGRAVKEEFAVPAAAGPEVDSAALKAAYVAAEAKFEADRLVLQAEFDRQIAEAYVAVEAAAEPIVKWLSAMGKRVETRIGEHVCHVASVDGKDVLRRSRVRKMVGQS